MGYNGLSLRDELAASLSDVSTSFKARVVGWLNDIQDDICNRFQWPFLKKTGIKVLVIGEEVQRLDIVEPLTPTISLSASGSLAIGSTYKVAVTYYRMSDDMETQSSIASSSVTCTSGFQTIIVSLPISAESVTGRKIYVSKDNGEYLYATSIADNTTLSYNITSDVSSILVPPDFVGIRAVYGSPYLTGSREVLLQYKTEDDLRFLFPGDFDSGAPEFWSDRSPNKIVLCPKPDSALTMKFVYIKIAPRIVASSESQPILPINFKEILKAGVLWKGYEFRERSAAASQRQIYEDMLQAAISTASRTTYTPKRVRDVNGNCDGFVV